MLFAILAGALFVVALGALGSGVFGLLEGKENGFSLFLVVLGVLALVGGYWAQTHRVVPTQYVGVSKNTFTQELEGLYGSGLASKPFFGSMYEYPNSSAYQQCAIYTPALEGSYGITVNLCFYYDTSAVDWMKEIDRTGNLEADYILNYWRNNVVGAVAEAFKTHTPEELSANRGLAEATVFNNVKPWFNEKGIPLVRVSLENWDFTSEQVGQAFDESIVSQRKITEQNALFEAAKISRDRQEYEAETSRIVAEKYSETFDELGLSEEATIQYLWIQLMSESEQVPDTVILGNTPVAVPAN